MFCSHCSAEVFSTAANFCYSCCKEVQRQRNEDKKEHFIEFGITAFPSIRAAVVASEKQQSVSGAERNRRMVRYLLSKCSLP